MELNITEFFNNGDHWHNCNSVANLGQNAGKITWENAKQETIDFNFITNETRQVIIDHFKEYGAWDDLDTWDDLELNTLLLQDISGHINDASFCICDDGVFDWEVYETECENGTLSGLLFLGDDNQVYYYLGT